MLCVCVGEECEVAGVMLAWWCGGVGSCGPGRAGDGRRGNADGIISMFNRKVKCHGDVLRMSSTGLDMQVRSGLRLLLCH
jgi:hypothetical protein